MFFRFSGHSTCFSTIDIYTQFTFLLSDEKVSTRYVDVGLKAKTFVQGALSILNGEGVKM